MPPGEHYAGFPVKKITPKAITSLEGRQYIVNARKRPHTHASHQTGHTSLHGTNTGDRGTFDQSAYTEFEYAQGFLFGKCNG